MLQAAGRKADAKLGQPSFSAELALRKAVAPGLGTSGAPKARDHLKATRRAPLLPLRARSVSARTAAPQRGPGAL